MALQKHTFSCNALTAPSAINSSLTSMAPSRSSHLPKASPLSTRLVGDILDLNHNSQWLLKTPGVPAWLEGLSLSGSVDVEEADKTVLCMAHDRLLQVPQPSPLGRDPWPLWAVRDCALSAQPCVPGLPSLGLFPSYQAGLMGLPPEPSMGGFLRGLLDSWAAEFTRSQDRKSLPWIMTKDGQGQSTH